MRDRGAQASSAEGRGLSDDDKIRMQLSIDVNTFIEEVCLLLWYLFGSVYYCKTKPQYYFIFQIEKLGVRRDSVERLQDLISLVENAIQGQQQAQN